MEMIIHQWAFIYCAVVFAEPFDPDTEEEAERVSLLLHSTWQ